MALPGLKDLLPDHLFYQQDARPPQPPPSSILSRLPVLDTERRPASYPASTPSYVDHRDAPYTYHQQPAPPTIALAPASMPGTQRPPKRAFDAQHPNIYGSAPLSGTFDQFGPVTVGAHADDHENADENEEDDDDDDEKRKHACEKCGKRFNRPSSLRIHLNTHTGAKPYVCPFPECNRSFNVSSNMRRHYRNHSRRAPPPLPINEIVAQAQAAQARVQMQIDMENQSRRTFSVEPPRLAHSGASGSMIDASASAEDNRNGNGSMTRGAEAAAKAVRKASISSSSFTRDSASHQSRHRSPYRSQRSPQAPPPPPLYAHQYDYSAAPAQHHYPLAPPNTTHRPPSPLPAIFGNSDRSQSYSPVDPTRYPYPDTHSHPHSSQPLRHHERSLTRSQYDTDSRDLDVDPRYGYPYPSAPPALVHASSSYLSSVYREDGERGREKAARYAIPPTPPHTNEAALSPPAYANGNRNGNRAVSGEGYYDRVRNRSQDRNLDRDRQRAYERSESDRGSYSYERSPPRPSRHLTRDFESDQSRQHERIRNWDGGPGKDGEEDIYRPPVPLRPILASPYEEDGSRRRNGTSKTGITSTSSTSQERVVDYARTPRSHSQSSHRHRLESDSSCTEARGLEDLRYLARHSREGPISHSTPHHAEEYRSERERETGVRRQQPSPDTPSLHVSSLQEESSYLRSHRYDPVPSRGDNYEHDQHYRRRESFSVSPNHPASKEATPTYEPAAPISIEEHTTSPSASMLPRPQCKSRLRSDSNSCPRSDANRNTLDTEPSPRHSLSNLSSQPDSKENDTTEKRVGRTPGAAPPPPYPLYTYPPPELPAAEDERKSNENGRATKRRKRG